MSAFADARYYANREKQILDKIENKLQAVRTLAHSVDPAGKNTRRARKLLWQASQLMAELQDVDYYRDTTEMSAQIIESCT